MQFSCAILAGGAGRRFGGSVKSKLVIGGRTIISRILETVEPVFDEKIIVTNTPGEFTGSGHLKVVGDQFVRHGPLAGIHAALKNSESDFVFVIAGDMPFLDRDLIRLQIAEFDKLPCEALIPEIGGLIEPLHAIYSKSVADRIEAFFAAGKSLAIRDLLPELDVRYLEMELSENTKRAFTNINIPGDLEKLDS